MIRRLRSREKLTLIAAAISSAIRAITSIIVFELLALVLAALVFASEICALTFSTAVVRLSAALLAGPSTSRAAFAVRCPRASETTWLSSFTHVASEPFSDFTAACASGVVAYPLSFWTVWRKV